MGMSYTVTGFCRLTRRIAPEDRKGQVDIVNFSTLL